MVLISITTDLTLKQQIWF